MSVSTNVSREESNYAVGFKFWSIIGIITFIATVLVSLLNNSCIVAVRPATSESTGTFVSLNARIHLQKITSLGPRPAGSIANELLTPEFFRQVLYDIAYQANASGLSAAVDEQISQYSSFQTHFHVSSYNNLRNFVLRIHDPRTKSVPNNKSAFMINCHYDSVITSPGASDDFVACAIMLEVARVIATGKVRMVNDLIFLFNGAEESILLASHAFITQHPWSSDVMAFLNMEGVGGGGRLLLFQTGPGDAAELFMNIYSKTFSQPFGQVLAEELFQSGLLQSDTDFRVFRDFGRIPGIDLAYTDDGYCYHTPYDTESRISEDCLQKTGNDILEFVTAIVKSTDLQNISRLEVAHAVLENSMLMNLSSRDVTLSMLPKSTIHSKLENRQVYFDILGLKMFVMSWRWWRILNWFICILILGYLFFARRWSFVLAVVVQVFAQIFGFIIAAVWGWLIYNYGCRMSWYSTRHNIVGIFVLPFLCWNVCFHTYFFQFSNGIMASWSRVRELARRLGWNTDNSSRIPLLERDFFDAAIFIVFLIFAGLNIFNNRMVYILAFWSAGVLLGRLFSSVIHPADGYLTTEKFILTFLPILICHAHLCFRLFEFIIPFLGRAGQNVHADIIVSVCTYFLMLPVFLFLAGPLQCTTAECAGTLRLILLNACLSYAILVHASPYGFPYTVSLSKQTDDPSISPRFQRVGVFHSDRYLRFHPDDFNSTLEESHVWIIPFDDNGIRYLKPNSYPTSVPSSLLSVIYQTIEPNTTKDFGGLTELLNVEPTRCNGSLPYCGLASIYPFIHRVTDFYPIRTHSHKAQPKAKLRLLSKQKINDSNFVKQWNFTFSVDAGPASTQILLRFNTPFVRLVSWSFNSSYPLPVPMPMPKLMHPSDNNIGAHFFVSHTDAGAVNASRLSWNSPWKFWLIVNSTTGVDDVPYFDLAVVSIHNDPHLPSDSSVELSDVLSRLPPWVVPFHVCTTYDHYRFGMR